jgi:protein-tyrosine phosphatase
MKILMVCLGNICRSPLAEGILQDKAAKAGLDWTVESAGTNGYRIGTGAHNLSQKVALLNGIDIGHHKCRQFRKEDIAAFDKIFVMDNDNYDQVRKISGDAWDERKVSLLLDEIYPGEKRNIPDPWYGTEKDYHAVFALIDRACGKVVEHYREG